MAEQPKIVVNSSGIGFSGWLTLVFVAAKLTGHFPYSWWWVASPILFVCGFSLLLLLIGLGIMLIALGLQR